MTYAVKDITLVPSAANNETSPYAKQVVVEGTDAAGNKVILPSDMIKGYSIANNVGDYFGVDARGVVYVADATKDIPTNAKVAVTLNVSTGTQTIYSNVLTSSKDSAKVSSIEIYKLSDGAENANDLGTDISENGVTSLPIEATPVSTITYTGVETYCLVTKDQYGVYKTYKGGEDLSIVINTKAVTTGTATVDKTTGLLKFSGITDAVQNKPITMSATINGVTSTFTTTFAGVDRFNPAAGSINVSGYTAESTITLTFSQAVKVSNVTLTNLKLNGDKTFGTGANIAVTPATSEYATEFVITLGEGANVTQGDTITISAVNVEDAFGNVASANVIFECPAATPANP